MSLLKQAIVDAANLKEAALKNAEQLILEKYSSEVKTAIDSCWCHVWENSSAREKLDGKFDI